MDGVISGGILCSSTECVSAPQLDTSTRKRVREEFEEYDYSELYSDLSTEVASPNITEYEVSSGDWIRRSSC